MADVGREHIEIVEGAGGPKPRIVGHRIRVIDLAIWHERLGLSAPEIVAAYPRLSLADDSAALAYHFDRYWTARGKERPSIGTTTMASLLATAGAARAPGRALSPGDRWHGEGLGHCSIELRRVRMTSRGRIPTGPQ